jgi:hypothetical protein
VSGLIVRVMILRSTTCSASLVDLAAHRVQAAYTQRLMLASAGFERAGAEAG